MKALLLLAFLQVAGVQFQVNGVNVGPEDTQSPYEIQWDSTKFQNGQHMIRAVARDLAGNVGVSEPIPVTVRNTPTAPLVSALWTQSAINLQWDPSTEAFTVGYRVYRSITPGQYSTPSSSLLTLPAYTDTQVESGREYFYVVRAIANDGVESLNSNEVRVAIPAPPPPPLDTISPVLSILSAARTNERLTISFTATDNFGVIEARLYVDGRLVDTLSGPLGRYTLQTRWQPPTIPVGLHRIRVEVEDAAGHITPRERNWRRQ